MAKVADQRVFVLSKGALTLRGGGPAAAKALQAQSLLPIFCAKSQIVTHDEHSAFTCSISRTQAAALAGAAFCTVHASHSAAPPPVLSRWFQP
jgi:hypothetical protein